MAGRRSACAFVLERRSERRMSVGVGDLWTVKVAAQSLLPYRHGGEPHRSISALSQLAPHYDTHAQDTSACTTI